MHVSDYNSSTKTPTTYSRHLLKCILKFLPNNPNFCPSVKEIEEEEYYKKCVKNLLLLCMDNDTTILIDDILKLLKDKLSKYEEFPIVQEDNDINDNLSNTSNHTSKVSSPNFGNESKTPSRNGSPLVTSHNNPSSKDFYSLEKNVSPSASLPNINLHSESNNNNNNNNKKNSSSDNLNRQSHSSGSSDTTDHNNNDSHLSEATMRLMDKYTNIRKSTKYPIRSLGIYNYVLIFLRLMIEIFEVGYLFRDCNTFSDLSTIEKRRELEKSFHLFYANNNTAFKLLKFGISRPNANDTNNLKKDINSSNRTRPQKLPYKTFRKLLRFLIAIKSSVKLDDCVAKIVKEDQLLLPNMKALIFKSLKTSSIHVASNGNFLNHDDAKLDTIPHLKEARDMVDVNVEYILSFLANSNGQDYMHFLEQIMIVNPGPEAFKDKFVLQELKEKYVKHNEFDEIDTERFINEELNNNDNYSLNTAFSSSSNASNGEGNTRYILIPAYLSLFTSDLLFSTEYISFTSFQNIKDLTVFIQFIHKLHKTYKRSIFRKCILLSFAHSLKIFMASKSADYLKYTHNNNTPQSTILKKELTSLFNSVYGSFDTLRLINDIYGNSTGTTINYKSSKFTSSGGGDDETSEEGGFDDERQNVNMSPSSKHSERNNLNVTTSSSSSTILSFKDATPDKGISSNDSKNSPSKESINEMMQLLNSISKNGLVLTDAGDAYHFGTCNIEDELLNPGDIAVTRSLTMISLFNVDVFANYLNKPDIKGLDNVEKSDSSSNSSPTDSKNYKPISSFVKNLKVKSDSSDRISLSSSNSEQTNSSMGPSSPSSSSFISAHLESQTKNVGSAIKNNLFKMSKLPNYYSTNKENKFWSSLMKHFCTSQALEISDRSNLTIFSVLLHVYLMCGFLNIHDSSSPIIKFAKRLSSSFGLIFQINDTDDLPKNLAYAQRVLNRNLPSKTKAVVENIISSLLLFPEATAETLGRKCEIATTSQEFSVNIHYELYCISEGMKFFFYIPNPYKEKYGIYNKIVEVIKRMTFHISGKLIKSLPYLDDNASEIIDDIIFERYKPEEHDIYYFIGKRNHNVLQKFFENDSIETITPQEYQDMLGYKKSIELSLIETNTFINNKYSENSAYKPNINFVNIGSPQESKLSEFLATSLISNTVNILKRCSSLTTDENIAEALTMHLEYTEKILLSGVLNTNEKLVKECVSCYDIIAQTSIPENNFKVFRAFYQTSGKTAFLLSVSSFNLSLPDITRLTMLQVLERVLKFRKNFYKFVFVDSENSINEHETSVFDSLHQALFRTILINLSFNDVKAHETLRSLCFLYTAEVDFYCSYKKKNIEDIDSCYYDFAQSIANCNNVFGPIAFQRHIRADILKYIDRPSRALFDCFMVLCDKVFDMCIVGQNSLLRDDQTRFRNYCGILASFIGVFKIDFLSARGASNVLDKYKLLISKKIDFFIERQCELLNSSDLLTRENSKDILSTELHPGVFNILFEKLVQRLDMFVEICKTGEIERNFFLLEQILAVLRSILERDEISFIILCTKSVLDIIQKVLNIIALMDYNTHYKYKVIIHTSKAILSFKHAENVLFLKGAYSLKNYWLQTIFSWFSDVAFVDLDLINLTKAHREMDLEKRDIDYLRLDTSIECVKALAFLTDKISLEAPAATTADDLKISKRSAFSNYFNILLKSLERTSDHESVPFVLRHKTLMLNENVLFCLTNLLCSNPDIGLDFVLPIAFTGNSIIRRTLLDVLIELTKNANKDRSVLTTDQEKALNDIIKQTEICPQILTGLASQASVNEVERLATSFLKICAPKKITHIFIAELVDDEIAKASRYMDILRRNSLATRSLAIFSRLKGYDFLNKTVRPLILDITIEGLDFEIEKPIADDAEREIQITRFVNCMDTFCENVLNAFDDLPAEFFYISQRIYDAANKKFPGSELISVGSFLFLRFFCPAIINPETDSIKNRISSKNRRTLILVAKVLQNLANKTINTLKWPLLEDQQQKLDEWSEKMFYFLAKVSDKKNLTPIPVDYSAPIEKLENLGTVHKLLYSRYVAIKVSMIKDVKDAKSFNELIESSRVVDKAMLQLGQPALELNNDIPKIIRENSEKYSLAYDFMNRYYLKVGSMPEISGLIFVSADSDGVPRITLSLKLMEMDTVDVNEVVYKLIFLESGLWTKKFNILLDGTATSQSSEKLERIMGLFMNLLPRDSFINLDTVIFYNINESFLLFWWSQAKKAYDSFGLGTLKHIFLTSNCSSEVFKSMQLQKYSVDIYNDVRVTLYNTSYYEEAKHRFVPVTLKIGNNHIQVVRETPKRIKFSENEEVCECHFNDIYFIKNMVSASASNTIGIPYEFTISFKDGTNLILSTHKYLEILKLLYYATTKLKEEAKFGGPVDTTIKKENTNESELNTLAKILLVILSALSSNDDFIKSRAFALLAVTQSTFNVDIGHNVFPTTEISLPADNLVLTKAMTKKLTKTKPELTYFILKQCFEGILSGKLLVNNVQLLTLISYWVENVHEYIYLDVDNNGKDRTIVILRLLIKCTLDDLDLMYSFKIFLWSKLMLVPDLLELITDEVITHAMDRESEGFDWSPCISILSMIPSVSVSGIVIQRLLKLINKLIPTLTNDNNVNSWSEVIILVSILQELSFDSCVSFEGFVPEVLYIISMLIDVRPIKIKTSLLKILINICNSFISATGDDYEKRQNFNNCIDILTSARAKYVFGLSRENSNSYYSSTAAVLLSKVSYMSELINYMLLIMQIINKDASDEILWKAKYKDLILEAIFGEESYISARAMMYLSILCRDGVYEDLMKNLFTITSKVLADISNTEETMLHLVTHVVSYGNFVSGINNNNPRLLFQVCWLCHSFLMSPNLVIYHAGLVAMTSCLKRILRLANDTNVRINDAIWEDNRQGLGDCLKELEIVDKRVNTRKNFMFTHVHFISKAALVSHTKVYGTDFLKMLLLVTLKEDGDHLETSTDYHCYMFLYFLLQTTEEFDELHRELNNGKSPTYEFINKDFEMPDFLFAWLNNPEDDNKNLVLYQVSLLVSIDTIPEITKLRLLCISLHMAENHPLVFFEFMNNVIEEAAKCEERATMFELVSKSFEVSNVTITSPYYHQLGELENKMDQRLKNMNLEALSDLKSFQNVATGFVNDERSAIITMKRKRCLLKILDKIINDDYS